PAAFQKRNMPCPVDSASLVRAEVARQCRPMVGQIRDLAQSTSAQSTAAACAHAPAGSPKTIVAASTSANCIILSNPRAGEVDRGKRADRAWARPCNAQVVSYLVLRFRSRNS